MPKTPIPDPSKLTQEGLARYVDVFVVGFIQRAGLKVQVRRTQNYTTLKIALRRPDWNQ